MKRQKTVHSVEKGWVKLEPTSENLLYLKEMYEKGRSKKALERQIEEANIRRRNDLWYIKYFCRCYIQKLDDDESGDDIPETKYSSGESDMSACQLSDEERLSIDVLDKEAIRKR